MRNIQLIVIRRMGYHTLCYLKGSFSCLMHLLKSFCFAMTIFA